MVSENGGFMPTVSSASDAPGKVSPPLAKVQVPGTRRARQSKSRARSQKSLRRRSQAWEEAVKPSPAMRKPEASRVKRKFCVVHGMGFGKSPSQRAKRRKVAMQRRAMAASHQSFENAAGCLGVGVLVAKSGAG